MEDINVNRCAIEDHAHRALKRFLTRSVVTVAGQFSILLNHAAHDRPNAALTARVHCLVDTLRCRTIATPMTSLAPSARSWSRSNAFVARRCSRTNLVGLTKATADSPAIRS